MVIYGFDYPNQSVDTLIEAFETLADRRVVLGPLNEVELGPLVHPVHAAGRVLARIRSRHDAARAGGGERRWAPSLRVGGRAESPMDRRVATLCQTRVRSRALEPGSTKSEISRVRAMEKE